MTSFFLNQKLHAKSLFFEQGWDKIDNKLSYKVDFEFIALTELKLEHKISGFVFLAKIKSKQGKSIEVRVLNINLKFCKEKEVHRGLKHENEVSKIKETL